MPKNIATVFTMREVDGVESKEICTHAEHLRKQPVGDAAPRADGFAALPGNELVWQTDMKLMEALKTRWIVWVWNHTPTCAEMSRLASQSLEQPLSLKMRFKMWLHFLICVWCERYYKHLKFLHRAAPQFAEQLRRFDQAITERSDDSSAQATTTDKWLLDQLSAHRNCWNLVGGCKPLRTVRFLILAPTTLKRCYFAGRG